MRTPPECKMCNGCVPKKVSLTLAEKAECIAITTNLINMIPDLWVLVNEINKPEAIEAMENYVTNIKKLHAALIPYSSK